MTPTLLILAAGMGSRYGGLKQLDRFGPKKLTIMDYSIRDAIACGFKKVVFVIRKDFENQFKEQISNNYVSEIEIQHVFQEIKIEGLLSQRTKPWGTGHAILSAASAIHDPFAVINADDFYGKKAFRIAHDFLQNKCTPNTYGMVAYILSNTLSPHGTVSRGVCTVDRNKHLVSVEEHSKIHEKNGLISAKNAASEDCCLPAETLVSMNLWMFHQEIFSGLSQAFEEFLNQYAIEEGVEFYIPSYIDDQLKSGKISVVVEQSPDKWYGVTYKEDRERVDKALERMG
ncbi:MAG: nucleotidyltransferase [Saprospirales bacterium]|nr:MAG: nucleotidyltransferase [Saprospirales bacterium]